MKDFIKNFVIIFFCLLMFAGILSYFQQNEDKKPEVIGIGQLIEEINAGQVKKVTVQGDLLSVELHDHCLLYTSPSPRDS